MAVGFPPSHIIRQRWDGLGRWDAPNSREFHQSRAMPVCGPALWGYPALRGCACKQLPGGCFEHPVTWPPCRRLWRLRWASGERMRGGPAHDGSTLRRLQQAVQFGLCHRQLCQRGVHRAGLSCRQGGKGRLSGREGRLGRWCVGIFTPPVRTDWAPVRGQSGPVRPVRPN